MTLQRQIAAGLLAEPERCCPIAWAWLSPEDFDATLDGREARFVFELLVEAWQQAEGRFSGSGPRYAALLARFYADEFQVPLEVGAAWIEAMLADGLPASVVGVFEAAMERLAAQRLVERARDAVGQVYAGMTPLAYEVGFRPKRLLRICADDGEREPWDTTRAHTLIDAALERLQELRAGLPAGAAHPEGSLAATGHKVEAAFR